MIYVRTCQECGHKQESKPPAEYKGKGWQDVKCRKCKSYGLDYGSYGWIRDPDTGKLKRKEE